MKAFLLRAPVLIAWLINALWCVACVAVMIDVLWERFGPDNPYYGEAISMAPNMPMLALILLLYLAAVTVPLLLFLWAYEKFVLSRRGLTLVLSIGSAPWRLLSAFGWGLAACYFAFLIYLNWNVSRDELPDPEFGWWAVLEPLIWTDIIYGGGAMIVVLLVRLWWGRAISRAT